jgi:thioredoxin 2
MVSADSTLHIVCSSCNSVNRVRSDRLHDHPICGGCRNQLFLQSPVVLDDRTFEKQIARRSGALEQAQLVQWVRSVVG